MTRAEQKLVYDTTRQYPEHPAGTKHRLLWEALEESEPTVYGEHFEENLDWATKLDLNKLMEKQTELITKEMQIMDKWEDESRRHTRAGGMPKTHLTNIKIH